MRLTPQRVRILDAVRGLEHATPDGLAAAVGRDGGPALSLSTIYRNLEVLEAVGVVSHTHLVPTSTTAHRPITCPTTPTTSISSACPVEPLSRARLPPPIRSSGIF